MPITAPLNASDQTALNNAQVLVSLDAAVSLDCGCIRLIEADPRGFLVKRGFYHPLDRAPFRSADQAGAFRAQNALAVVRRWRQSPVVRVVKEALETFDMLYAVSNHPLPWQLFYYDVMTTVYHSEIRELGVTPDGLAVFRNGCRFAGRKLFEERGSSTLIDGTRLPMVINAREITLEPPRG